MTKSCETFCKHFTIKFNGLLVEITSKLYTDLLLLWKSIASGLDRLEGECFSSLYSHFGSNGVLEICGLLFESDSGSVTFEFRGQLVEIESDLFPNLFAWENIR